ncbi:protein JINGUBANG-like [Silene latifolia]|uniref:protein JINGUBANG-like n=1 Tax=Silene latifolia TaxID=37657 RepID=UPI003D78669E
MAYNVIDGLLYTGSHDKTVKAWKITDRKCVDSFLAHADTINAMEINDKGYLFTCSSDGTLKMWSKVSGENLHTLTMTLHFNPFPINTLALTNSTSNEDGFLYGGASDGGIYYWEQQITGEYIRRGCMKGHQFAVASVAAVADLVVSGGVDTTVRIWRRKKRWCYECVGVLEGHNGPVKCVKVCLEEESFVKGFLVFSGGLDKCFKVWRVRVLGDASHDADHLSDSASNVNDGEDD